MKSGSIVLQVNTHRLMMIRHHYDSHPPLTAAYAALLLHMQHCPPAARKSTEHISSSSSYIYLNWICDVIGSQNALHFLIHSIVHLYYFIAECQVATIFLTTVYNCTTRKWVHIISQITYNRYWTITTTCFFSQPNFLKGGHLQTVTEIFTGQMPILLPKTLKDHITAIKI